MGYIFIIVGLVFIIISFIVTRIRARNTDYYSEFNYNNQNLNFKTILDFLLQNHIISTEQFINAQYMQQQEMISFLNQQIQNLNFEQQSLFMNQMHFDQMEMNRLMSTGIEFGGFNPDLNLNPSMLNEHFMNDMNNGSGMGGMGGPGMM